MQETKSITKQFIEYVSLNVLSMIGLSCYIFADTYFISSGVGSMGVAALNLVLPLYNSMSGMAHMLGMGAATRYSILKGEGREREASGVFTHVIAVGIVASALLFFVGLFAARPIASLLGAEGQVLSYATIYLRTFLLFAPAYTINQIFIYFVRNDHQPNLAMAAMLTGSFSNVILDYVFIFPLGWGMFGAAFATGLAPVISLAILSLHFRGGKSGFRLVRCKASPRLVRRIFALGLPSFITEVTTGFVMMIFNFLILGLTGSIGVAAYGILVNLMYVMISIFNGVAQGIQPIVSYQLGRGNHQAIKKVILYASVLAGVLGSAFFLVGIFFPGPIASIFNKEGNAQLMEIATHGIRLYFAAFLFMGLNVVVGSFLAAVARPIQSLTICLLRGFVAVVPLAFLLSHLYQMTGIWLTTPCAEAITVVFTAIFLASYLRIDHVADVDYR